MQSTAVNWEDEENNRIISLAVDFTAGDVVELHRLTPTKVTFLCPDTRTQLRSVGVHSNAGRRILAHAFLDAGKLPELKSRLLEHEPHAVPSELPALDAASSPTGSLSRA